MVLFQTLTVKILLFRTRFRRYETRRRKVISRCGGEGSVTGELVLGCVGKTTLDSLVSAIELQIHKSMCIIKHMAQPKLSSIPNDASLYLMSQFQKKFLHVRVIRIHVSVVFCGRCLRLPRELNKRNFRPIRQCKYFSRLASG